MEDLGLGDPVKELTGIKTIDHFSTYHEAALFNQPYSPSLLGKYWCQVINTTADPDHPLMRSNVFTLLAPGDYSGPTCNSMPGLKYQTVGINLTCADQHSEQTAMPPAPNGITNVRCLMGNNSALHVVFNFTV